MYMYHIFIHSSVNGPLGCFHVLGIVCSEHWGECIFLNYTWGALVIIVFLWMYAQEWD